MRIYLRAVRYAIILKLYRLRLWAEEKHQWLEDWRDDTITYYEQGHIALAAQISARLAKREEEGRIAQQEVFGELRQLQSDRDGAESESAVSTVKVL
jgi:hypothetical protein